MSPWKIPRHKVAPPPLPIWTKFYIWSNVELIAEIGVGQDIADDHIGVAVPNLIFIPLPARSIGRKVRIHLGDKTLPRRTTLLDGINQLVHLVVVLERSEVTMFEHCKSPELHKLIDISLRHLYLPKQKISDSELKWILEGLSDILRLDRRWQWCTGRKECAIEITW